MSLFNRNKTGGFMDVIRCDEPSYLIWKWHPSGSQLGENKRENQIRWGSRLRVKDGEVAIFVYKQKDGIMQDYVEGPFDEKIRTGNLPVLANLVNILWEGDSPFQAEIYFINLAKIIQTKFVVPFFDVYDPRFQDFAVPVAVRGTLSFKISDYREFIKLHRLINFNLNDFQAQIKDAVTRYVKTAVANAPYDNKIPVIQLERTTGKVTETIEDSLKARMHDDFGVDVSGIDINAIEIDKTSTGYCQLKRVTLDVADATIQAQTAVNIKDIQDKQRIAAENLQETLRVQREEGQYAMHKQTQQSNFAAYQVEKQAEVGVAGANALGQMGANGAGNVDMSGGGVGFNPAAVMTGIALGGVVGQNMAGVMGNAMSGMNTMGSVPPPIPMSTYHVAVNGQATGPFDLNILRNMANSMQFNENSLVWKAGMQQWEKAGNVEELKNIFVKMPPIPPTE